MLKALRTELNKLDDQIRAGRDEAFPLVLICRLEADETEAAQPCVGYAGDYRIAGEQRHLFFAGTDPEPMVRALFDHAHRIEGGSRPGCVLFQQEAAPDDAVNIGTPPEGITLAEHAARLYEAIQAAA